MGGNKGALSALICQIKKTPALLIRRKVSQPQESILSAGRAAEVKMDLSLSLSMSPEGYAKLSPILLPAETFPKANVWGKPLQNFAKEDILDSGRFNLSKPDL